jgi:Protein of unknown function (DUF3237)
MKGAGMSSIDLPGANVEAVAGLHDRPGVLIYEYTPQVTHVVEYGASADAVLSGQAPPPAEGARFDLYLEGPVKGPNLVGTVEGVDYLWVRADGRAELHIHAKITTEDGKKIAVDAGGVAVPEESSSVFRIREHVKLTSNHPELLWVNLLEIWASGTFDFTNGQVRV